MYKFLLSLCFLSLGCPGSPCGNSLLDAGEACDDGNTSNADGCEANCSLPACNNGIVDPGEVCFFAPVLFETDIAPTGVVSADFNGDGTPDLMTANAAGNSLSVLLGDGVGGFVRSPDVELGQITFSAAVGEFNGDGVLDLAASLPNLNEIKVFRGLGDGSFAPLVTLSVVDPDALVVADFDGNGLSDLASTSGTGIVVFRGGGPGGFLAPIFSEVGSQMFELKSGDFDGNNIPDLVALTNDNNGTILIVLLGDGPGSFPVQLLEPLSDGSVALLAADTSGDGFVDVSVGNLSGNVFTSEGNGAGDFSLAQTLSIFGPVALAAGDLNSDGFLDIAVASDFDLISSHLGVLFGGAGGFDLLPLFPASNGNLRGLALHDLNEDGALDAVLTDQTNAQVIVFLSQP